MYQHLLLGSAAAALLAALSANTALAEEVQLPTIWVDATAEDFSTALSERDLKDAGPPAPDSAGLLVNLPGIALQSGGALSSLPVLHGLADDRVKILIDGMTVTSTCPNHMNPAMSYIDPTRVGRLTSFAGITPVSLGGDSIGGTILVDPPLPLFATVQSPVLNTATLSTFFRSNTSGISVAGSATMATPVLSITYDGGWSRDMDYHRGGDGEAVRSTQAQTYNHNLTFGIRRGGDQLTLRGGLQYTPYEGFPNQRMDLTDNESQYLNGRYQGDFAWGALEVGAYWQHVEHEMDMLEDKGGAMPMNTRSTELGYAISAEIPLNARDTLRIGTELHHLELDDWWPPVDGSMMMGPGIYENINDGSRNRIGTYVEWQAQWSAAWDTEIGLRNDIVWMDTGEVRPYSWTGMMNAADAAAAIAFNALDRSRTDVNIDFTAIVRYTATPMSTFSLGYARKTRSPSLYERYTWGKGHMAAAMNNWFGDANGYLGNPDLDPEIAHTASISGDFHDAGRSAWQLKVTPYVSYVEDFIDADPTGETFGPGGQFVRLRFANHDALLYGVDLSGSLALVRSAGWGNFDLTGVVGFVKGENRDSGDELYHMVPLNLRLSLDHRLGDWSNGIELVASATKDAVNAARREPETSAYALVNLETAYQWPGIRIDAGIDNLLDQRYYEPLGGVDFADFKAEGGTIGALPAPGRSFKIGLTLTY